MDSAGPADQSELTGPGPGGLAGLGTGGPLGPPRVERLVELEHAPRLPGELPPLDHVKVLLPASALLAGSFLFEDVGATDRGHGAVAFPDLFALALAAGPLGPRGVDPGQVDVLGADGVVGTKPVIL